MTPTSARWQVLGLGRVGTPLALALHRQDLLVRTWTRSEVGRRRAAAAGLPAPGAKLAIDDSVTHVLVAVPDDVVTRFCRALAGSERSVSNRVWLHTSGSLDAEALRDAGIVGPAGSCHPLQSMTGEAADLSRLAGAFFAVEGDSAAVAAATGLARLVGGEPHELRGADKVAYHCAAVLASNGVYALLNAAGRVAESAGIASEALERSLARLAQGSAVNAQSATIANASTGPVVRGDAGTVRSHLEHLRAAGHDGSAETLYREVARELLRIGDANDARKSALAAVAAVLEEGTAT